MQNTELVVTAPLCFASGDIQHFNQRLILGFCSSGEGRLDSERKEVVSNHKIFPISDLRTFGV